MADIDTHSRLIAWLKIALPLMALAILSTLFLVARTIDPEDAIPYAEVDVEERLREPRMTDPTYAAVTEDGAALTLAATEARPDAGANGSGTARMLIGRLETPDGVTSDLTAGSVRLDAPAQTVVLGEGVEVQQSNGWMLTTESLVVRLDRTDIQSESRVEAVGPVGNLSADSLHLSETEGQTGQYLLVFNGAVKLIYQPRIE